MTSAAARWGTDVARKISLALLFAASAAVTSLPATADAQIRHSRVVVVGGYYYSPFFYDPFFSSWYGYPYPYGYYPFFARPEADVRVLVTPKEAEVYVDGYYAGIVDDFNGVFQRLHVVPPGEHEITLHLQGYRTVTQKLYLAADSTYKLRYTMEKLGPGEVSEPPPARPAPPPQEAQTPPQPRMGPRQGVPPMGRMPPPQPQGEPPGPGQPPGPGAASNFGALVIQTQPAGAEILIDGQRWTGSEGGARLVVQLADGAHRVEIQKEGYRPYSAEVQVHRGETIPLNVSLSPDRE